jgi:hypothetical protein
MLDLKQITLRRRIVYSALEPCLRGNGINLFFSKGKNQYPMSGSENPMAYLLEFGLRKVERERPELNNDGTYLDLKAQLLREAEGHFHEIQATYATVLKTQCHCGGQLEPVDHEFGKEGGIIYDSVIAKCKACGETQSFQFPKEGFISEARSAMALRDYLQGTYGIDYARLIMGELRRGPQKQ